MAFDAVFHPVLRADDPRAVGLSQDPHDNSMLSCLSSGFLWPLDSTARIRGLTPHESGSYRRDKSHLGSGAAQPIFSQASAADGTALISAYRLLPLQRTSWRLPMSWRKHMWCVFWTCVTWVEIKWRCSSARCTELQMLRSTRKKGHLFIIAVNHVCLFYLIEKTGMTNIFINVICIFYD